MIGWRVAGAPGGAALAERVAAEGAAITVALTSIYAASAKPRCARGDCRRRARNGRLGLLLAFTMVRPLLEQCPAGRTRKHTRAVVLLLVSTIVAALARTPFLPYCGRRRVVGAAQWQLVRARRRPR